MAEIYPLVMEFGSDDGPISVFITREGWSHRAIGDLLAFNRLSTSERLRLRREFAAQVALAQHTPRRENTR